MGTHISVFLTHTLPSWRDASDTLTRLRRTEPSCCEIGEYWRTVQGYEHDATQWDIYEALEDSVRYTGPGFLRLEITPHAALIQTGGRWRGFLSNEPLRRVHLAAFQSIAEALCSGTMALSHDSTEPAHELFWSGARQS